MKILSIQQVVSFAKAHTPKTELLWHGRTIYILSAFTGICLAYLLRDRLRELIFGVSHNNLPNNPPKVTEVFELADDCIEAIGTDQLEDDPNNLKYIAFGTARISFQQHIELLQAELLNWKEETAPSRWAGRLKYCKEVMSDLQEQIERICDDGFEIEPGEGFRKRHFVAAEAPDMTSQPQLLSKGLQQMIQNDDKIIAQWDACQDQLSELMQLNNGEVVCQGLTTLFKTLLQLDEQRLKPFDSELGLYKSREFESYQEYLGYLFSNIQQEFKEELSELKITQQEIKEIRRKSFDGEWRKLRIYVGWNFKENLEQNAPIYLQLDLAYKIVKPLEAEIRQLYEELALEPYAQEAVKKLKDMRVLLFSLLGEPKFFGKYIEKIEALDKERQISQLKNYQQKIQEDKATKKAHR